MSTGTAVLIVGGLAVAGGLTYVVLSRKQRAVVAATPKASSSGGGGVTTAKIVSLAGSALSLGGSIASLWS
jgi:hypothetical protein